MVRGTGVAAERRHHLSSLALPHRATARSSDVERKVRPIEAADAECYCSRSGATRRIPRRSLRRGNEGLFTTGAKKSDRPRSAFLPNSPSNGEVEGPPRSANRAPRAHTVFPRPRRVTTDRSRTPPTIVRSHPHNYHCARAAPVPQARASESPAQARPPTRPTKPTHASRPDRSGMGARPALNQRRRRPHVHSDASNEDACRAIVSASPRAPSAPNEGVRCSSRCLISPT